MTGPGSSSAGIDAWVAQAKAKAERYQEMRAQAQQISVTDTEGPVTVTIDSSGNVTDLRIKDHDELARAVLLTMRRAQARLPERLAEVMAETIGDDRQTVDTIVGNYRAKFPEPQVDENPPPPRPGTDDDEGFGSVMDR
ncbi:YbaB/EbfC family nucleoid-associated protein [Lentzea sp. NPDC004782]|uniref:YbaB/EbfC family nucleoid-associated protein n=1 Tax=Lentzea sp. NPDC004782 TaxID=3154458 RepID=UPI0033B82819